MPTLGYRELAHEVLVIMISFKMILKYCFKYAFSNQIFFQRGSFEKYLLGLRKTFCGPTTTLLCLKQVFHLSHTFFSDPRRRKLTE